MKKSELKSILKPLVKECIQETLYESGLLSSIIAEVLQGVQGSQAIISENRPVATRQQSQPELAENNKASEQKRTQLRETKKNLLDSIGREAYNGVDLFEGTTPLSRGGSPTSSPAASGPMSGIDPSDPGVDISGLTGALGGVWKKLAEGRKK